MKAITLWQPWATIMATGEKHIETRSWPTSYRGELAICSAKRKPTLGDCEGSMAWLEAASKFPLGFVLCVVEIYDCRGVEWIASQPWFGILEKNWGNYEVGQGRYGWMTRDCRRLPAPVPVVGRQGLFNLPAEVEAKVRNQL